MEYLLAVLTVWAVWNLASTFYEASEAVWLAVTLVLGIGAQILIDLDHWWWGVGIGGAAVLVMRLSDLLLVTADWIRFAALRQQRGTR